MLNQKRLAHGQRLKQLQHFPETLIAVVLVTHYVLCTPVMSSVDLLFYAEHLAKDLSGRDM